MRTQLRKDETDFAIYRADAAHNLGTWRDNTRGDPLSDYNDFKHSPILRHPTTWLFAAGIAIHGAINMYLIREAHRANGAPLQLGWLWVDRTVDVVFGAAVPIVSLLAVIWMVAGIIDNLHVWVRQLLVVTLYFGILLAFKYLR